MSDRTELPQGVYDNNVHLINTLNSDGKPILTPYTGDAFLTNGTIVRYLHGRVYSRFATIESQNRLPAIENPQSSLEFRINGTLHHDDGAAMIELPDLHPRYFLNGQELSQSEYDATELRDKLSFLNKDHPDLL